MYRTALAVIAFSALAFPSLAVAEAGGQSKALVYTPNFDGDSLDYEAAVADLFAGVGYQVTRLGAGALCDPEKLTEPSGTVLVLPDAGRLPLGSIGPVQEFLRRGGRLAAFNTPAWREVLVQADGKWMPVSDFRKQYARQVDKRVVVDWSGEDLSKWGRAHRSAELQGKYSVVEQGPEAGQAPRGGQASLRGQGVEHRAADDGGGRRGLRVHQRRRAPVEIHGPLRRRAGDLAEEQHDLARPRRR